MDILKDFPQKDFVDQITLLGEIREGGKLEAVPYLFSLMEELAGNDAVIYVIVNTLRALLSMSETATVEGIVSGTPAVRDLCIEVAGENGFHQAVPPLVRLAGERSDVRRLFAALSALARMQPDEALELFRAYMHHEEALIASLSVEMIGRYRDFSARQALCDIVSAAEADECYEDCTLHTAKAVWALGELGDEPSVAFLVSRIHHRNPTARRVIQQELARLGAPSLPYLEDILARDDVDARIMAANVLGLIGTREAAAVLVKALDKGLAGDLNVRFAIYEALGTAKSMKGLVCLTDALRETEEMVLMAVISSLDGQLNPTIADDIRRVVLGDASQGGRIVRAVVASRALVIFEALFEAGAQVIDALLQALGQSTDPELREIFAGKLEAMGEAEAADALRIPIPAAVVGSWRILAVDDSRAMLNFYRGAASAIGCEVDTAGNGQEGLERLQTEDPYDLIITDMNMPVMDGIEFTRKLRENPAFSRTPTVMVTTESERSQVELARKAGVDDFLQKPFAAERLQALIRRMLPLQ